ncbi:MAG: substrate-binding domain-containing protein [Anaerolineales bacterium]|nr:substrate-binding domain-containing protein [Anaerolineales bacterium]
MPYGYQRGLGWVLVLAALVACVPRQPEVLRLASTTSTEDSGLLQTLLPKFERDTDLRVDVVAVGTGQALALAAQGDVDVVLVHAPSMEAAFVSSGDGTARHAVMYNDFVVVGPPQDPAGIRQALSAAEALQRIAAATALFASRGDDSGTHAKELELWEASGIVPDVAGGWYQSLGQGMGETLVFAEEQGAYALTDRGTYLAQQAASPDLKILFGGRSIEDNPDPALRNPYGVISVSPLKHPGVNAEAAERFVAWLTSVETQAAIAAFGVDLYGQPLFFPDSEAWHAAHP